LQYSEFNEVIYDQVFPPGRYITGVNSKFIKFPSSLINVEFSSSNSSDVKLFNLY